MIVQVNTATYVASELLLDADGSPVTTKTNTDWTKTATLLGVGTTATPTITHRANGYYDILCTFSAVGVWSVEYSVDVDGATIRFDPRTVQVFTAAQIDPAAALAGYRVTVVSPIAQSGLITIKRGDWYNADDGRALEWIDENDQWPDLTDAIVVFAAKPSPLRNDLITVTGSVVVPTGAGKTIRVEFTTPDTEDKTPGTWSFDIQAVTSPDGHNVTLVTGTMVLQEDFVP